MTFAADITKFVEKTKIKGATVLRKVALDGLTGVILRSPVDTGRFRGSWRVGINAVDPSTLPPLPKGTKGVLGIPSTSELGTKTKKISEAKWGDTIFISNNVEYAKRLEDGSSSQAPQGVLGLTVAELQTKIGLLVKSVD